MKISFDFILKNITTLQAVATDVTKNFSTTYITHVLIDSRSSLLAHHHEGVSTTILFVCLQGQTHNAHDFIPFLYHEKGVRYFIIEQAIDTAAFADAIFIRVENTIQALQQLATAYRQLFHCPIWAITGSNGKTMVKEWLYEILCPLFPIARSPKSYNSQIGVALSLFNLSEESALGIFEAGISHKAEMAKLAAMLLPNVGIFTALGTAHGENFNTPQEKIEEKIQLFQTCEVIIIASEQKEVIQSLQQKYPNKKIFTYSFQKEDKVDVRIEKTEFEGKGTRIFFNYAQKAYTVYVPFQDAISLHNVSLVLCASLYLNVFEQVAQRFALLSTLPLHLEIMESKNALLINDAYSADWQAFTLSLAYLLQRQEYAKKSIILGDFLENTQDEAALYGEIARLVSHSKIYQLILVGTKITKHAALFKAVPKLLVFDSTAAALLQAPTWEIAEQVWLIKGARKLHLEKIAYFLQNKPHETWLEIRTDALLHNLQYFKKLLPPATKIMAMVKAKAYGSSEAEVVHFLQQQKVDYFGVAFESEGIALREAGITTPIMVMHAAAHRLSFQANHHLEPVIYSFAMLESYALQLQKMAHRHFPIHIKIDTGMHRLGFTPQAVPKVIAFLQKHAHLLHLQSVYSHLACADEPSLDAFTQQQIQDFEKVKVAFKNAFPTVFFHLLNSAGILRFAHAAADMARLGIGLYGFGTPAHQPFLAEALRCKTRIVHLQNLNAGEGIGYGNAGKLLQQSRIATLPIGYADGLRRALSEGRWQVSLHGYDCPIIGKVCMDFVMIDVSHVPNVHLGDEVILFGQGGHPLSAMATVLDTIPYEILTSLSSRIPRILVKE